MATEQSLQTITREAGQDLSAKQYHFVMVASDGQVDPSSDGGDALGVLQNDPAAAGRAASIGVAGITTVQVGAAVTQGNYAASDSAGRAVQPATGDHILGIFLSSATAADQKVELALIRGARKA